MPLSPDRKSAAPDHYMPPPSLPLLACLELRALWEFAAVLPAWPVLQQVRPGDGQWSSFLASRVTPPPCPCANQ